MLKGLTVRIAAPTAATHPPSLSFREPLSIVEGALSYTEVRVGDVLRIMHDDGSATLARFVGLETGIPYRKVVLPAKNYEITMKLELIGEESPRVALAEKRA